MHGASWVLGILGEHTVKHMIVHQLGCKPQTITK